MKISNELVRLFRERFVQRVDLYPIQLDRGGYTVVRRPLTGETIRKHLKAEITLGLYTSADSTTRWLCLDVDTTDERVMRSLWRRLDRAHIPHLTEFSGRKGYHLWVFFPSPVPNHMARALGRALTREHEVFPKQGRIAADGLGSLVKAPLGLHRVTGARCLFVDRDMNILSDQEQALAMVRTVDPIRTLARRFPKTWDQVGPKLQAPPDANSTFNPPSTLAPLPLIKDCVRRALLEGTRHGHRNQVGYMVATELRRIGISHERAQAVLSGVWNPRNSPPLPEAEIRTMVRSAYQGPKRTFGCRPDGGLRRALECVGQDRCLYAQIVRIRGRASCQEPTQTRR